VRSWVGNSGEGSKVQDHRHPSAPLPVHAPAMTGQRLRGALGTPAIDQPGRVPPRLS
jgi:hypothetical protein